MCPYTDVYPPTFKPIPHLRSKDKKARLSLAYKDIQIFLSFVDFHEGEAEPGVVRGLLHVSVYIITTSAWLCNLMWGVIVWDGGNDESMESAS